MPSRGYRKGVSDNKVPVTKSVRTHISDDEFAFLLIDSHNRHVTMSNLLRSLVKAHVSNGRAALPHPRSTNTQALRELARIGNNLNQLSHQANSGMVPIPQAELHKVLRQVQTAMVSL